MMQKCNEASRGLFSKDLDVEFWRCVAVSLDLLPIGSDNADVTRADLGAGAQGRNYFDLLTAPHSVQIPDALGAGRCAFKGSQCRFQKNMQGGPHTKYDALFDCRSELDEIRYAFCRLVGGNELAELREAAMSRRHEMSEESYQMLMRFVDNHSDAFADQTLDEQPSNFAARAWPVLRQCLTTKPSYYLSYKELLLVCEVHHQNLVVFGTRGQDSIVYVGSCIHDDQSAIRCVTLRRYIGNCRVRGHLRRLILSDTFDMLEEQWTQEAAKARSLAEPERPKETDLAMFSLSVRLLDGTSRQIDVAPETTLADIQATLEGQLSIYHEVRLLELQVLTVQSTTKALAELERLAAKADTIIKRTGDLIEQQDDYDLNMFAINKKLGEMQDLCPNGAARLLDFINNNCDSDFLNDYCREDIDGSMGEKLAMTFGRKCSDPSPHVATLVGWLDGRRDLRGYPPRSLMMMTRGHHQTRALAAIASFEIAERLGDATPDSLREALTRFAFSIALPFGERLNITETVGACRVLGLFGDDACMIALQDTINEFRDKRVKAAAAQALELIGTRMSEMARASAIVDPASVRLDMQPSLEQPQKIERIHAPASSSAAMHSWDNVPAPLPALSPLFCAGTPSGQVSVGIAALLKPSSRESTGGRAAKLKRWDAKNKGSA